MMPNPSAAELQSLQDLAERSMERLRGCFVCNEAPATMPLGFLGEPRGAGGARLCAVFAVCEECVSQQNFQARVNEVLQRDQHERRVGPWN
jgi:hypothetical protein